MATDPYDDILKRVLHDLSAEQRDRLLRELACNQGQDVNGEQQNGDVISRQLQSTEQLLKDLDALPSKSPGDGLSPSVDHDRILYGDK